MPRQETSHVQKPPTVAPFSFESAVQKVRQAEDAWNTRDPERVALAYTDGCKGGVSAVVVSLSHTDRSERRSG